MEGGSGIQSLGQCLLCAPHEENVTGNGTPPLESSGLPSRECYHTYLPENWPWGEAVLSIFQVGSLNFLALEPSDLHSNKSQWVPSEESVFGKAQDFLFSQTPWRKPSTWESRTTGSNSVHLEAFGVYRVICILMEGWTDKSNNFFQSKPSKQ